MIDQNRLVVDRRRGRGLLWLGMIVALSGIVIFFVLLYAKILIAPWYVPILASLGAALLLVALVRAQSIWRWTALLLFTAFAAAVWVMLLVVFALPPYTGPVKAGQPFPEFATTLADGSSFTQNDLKGEQNTAMFFFNGRG
jgi:hypothetical protein